MDCLFCKIAAGELPSRVAYEDELIFAFHDLDPKAPFHILLIPRAHIPSAADITPENSQLIARIFEAAAAIAAREGFSSSGYRIVANTGPDAGQTVPHLHFHMLAGRNLGWPPG